MPEYMISRYFGGRHRVTRVEAPTPNSPLEKAMAEDGVGYTIHRTDRPKEVFELTPNGLRGKLRTEGEAA